MALTTDSGELWPASARRPSWSSSWRTGSSSAPVTPSVHSMYTSPDNTLPTMMLGLRWLLEPYALGEEVAVGVPVALFDREIAGINPLLNPGVIFGELS